MNQQFDPAELLCFTAMAGSFPGASSVDTLWERILRAEVAPLTEMSARWGIAREAIFSAEPGTKNRTYLDRAYCLPPASEPGFSFPWGHQVAHTRSVLKQVINQAEQGGAVLERDSVALVMGTSWSDESYFMAGWRDKSRLQQGFDPSAQVQELARSLGLGGPALSTDTACSSFFYALEMAGTLIRTGQARRAIVAGVNAFLPPALFLGFSQLRALSNDGALRSFGEEANGLVPGECVAAFLVEPMSEAQRAGRKVLGTLRSLGISSDGAEGSVFAPGKQAQSVAYARAYEGIDPGTIDYIEAHGTGTPVGDATEHDSLDNFFRPYMIDGRQLPVGSVKALIGHTLAAAGAASLAKVLLMLQHRMLPPHGNFKPHARLQDSCLTLLNSAREFTTCKRALRIGISSFGFGGANAHVVIEEPMPVRSRRRPTAKKIAKNTGVVELNLAIIDLEAGFGSAASAHDWKCQLAGRAPAPKNFPLNRFDNDAAADLPSLCGGFLSGTMNIDIAGYRMGPRPLSHIDPFKLFLTHRAKTMLSRHPMLMGSLDTAIVVCANMGGERFFDSYRKIDDYYKGGHDAVPDLVVDDVATMLPTMISGYPSQILNLRGFHQTISGAPGMFWATFLSAPDWLIRRCRTLVLGAGHYLGSPIDVVNASKFGGNHGEGVGLLALKTIASAHEDANQVLATLRCVVYASAARTLEQARASAQMSCDDYHIEICELAPDSSTLFSGAQSSTGFLAEACGIESLLAAVMHHSSHSVVEVRRGGVPLFWLFLEKEKDAVPANDPAPKIPFELAFSATRPEMEQKIVMVSREDSILTEQSHRPMSLTCEAIEQMTRTLLTNLRVRSRAIELLGAIMPSDAGRMSASSPQLDELMRRSRSNASNIVLSDPRAVSGTLLATLHVDEGHPYFFDHPLDHVPGILLLEGVLQLADLAMEYYGINGMFIAAIDVRFKRYTEKQKTITIELKRTIQGDRFDVVLVQSGNQVCECSVALASACMRMPGHTSKPRTVPYPNKHLLHKSQDQNVLIGAMEDHADGLRVPTADVPEGHFFRDGSSDTYSLLYFLEIARQCFMLVAHTRLNVPLDVSMNLIELHFEITAPIPRDAAFTIMPEYQGERWTGLLQKGRVEMTLLAPDELLGKAVIVSQVLRKDIYAIQRNAANVQSVRTEVS